MNRQDEEPPYPSPGYAWYVVGVLTLIYVFSFIDRQILNLLVRFIRRDLGISETQMSLLMGFTFAVFYTFFGIPIGRMVDSLSRRLIIGVGLILWSLTTAGCGLAQTFTQLAILRMGVGIGEAALSPSAYSIITDNFRKEKLATAISVYSMGIYLGQGLASLLGGIVISYAGDQESWNLPIVGATRPWQVVFFMVGLPGLALSLLLLTIKEPIRRGLKAASSVSLGEVGQYVGQNWKTFLCHGVGFGLLALAGYGGSAWIPTFFVRVHHWKEADAGKVYGTITMIAGTLGVTLGGRFADWLARRGCRDSKMRVGMFAAMGWIPCGLLFPMMPNPKLAVLFLIPTVFCASIPFGVAPAAIQEMMPARMRGQASAIYLFIINLIGLGVGPTAIATVTQKVFKWDNSVGYSMMIVCATAQYLAALILWLGLKRFRQSMDRLQQWTASNA